MKKLEIFGKELETPAYFPSVSSTAVAAPTPQLIEFLIESECPYLLVSAYDMANLPEDKADSILETLRKYREKEGILFCDSGVYESYWLKDDSWHLNDFTATMSELQVDIYTAYDGGTLNPETRRHTEPYKDQDIEASLNAQDNALFLPILHPQKPSHIDQVVNNLLDDFGGEVAGVALAERDCGPTLTERCKRLKTARDKLDEVDEDLILHLLGTGHPHSIAAFVAVGVDMFDSLDWCQSGIDWEDRGLTDSSHVAHSGCPCEICEELGGKNPEAVYLHNLLFYRKFDRQLQQMIDDNTLMNFVRTTIGPEFGKDLEAILS